MNNLLDPTAQASIRFRIYRYRFLFVYILIGVASLCVEILLLRSLNYLGLAFGWASVVGLAASGTYRIPCTRSRCPCPPRRSIPTRRPPSSSSTCTWSATRQSARTNSTSWCAGSGDDDDMILRKDVAGRWRLLGQSPANPRAK